MLIIQHIAIVSAESNEIMTYSSLFLEPALQHLCVVLCVLYDDALPALG